MIKKFASLLLADASNYGNIILNIQKKGFDGFHFDIMDGHFVRNFAFSPGIIKCLRKFTNLPFQAHLEIENPAEYIDIFIESGCDIITLHPQTCDIERELRYIRSKNKISSVAIDPDIKIDIITDFLPLIDNIVVMTVYPGFADQNFDEKQLEKVRCLKKIIKSEKLGLTISVDGGVNSSTEGQIIKSGADILIYGSYLFK